MVPTMPRGSSSVTAMNRPPRTNSQQGASAPAGSTAAAGHAGRQHEHEQLVGLDPVAEEARARLGIADRYQHHPVLRRDNGAAYDEAERERQAGDRKQRRAGGRRLHVEAEDVLEIGGGGGARKT